MSKRLFILAHEAARANALDCIRMAPNGYAVTVSEPTRNLQQNSKLWAALGDIANQVVWHGAKLSKEDWKDLITASLRKQRSAPGVDGGFVVFGERTKTYTKSEFSELIECIYAFGAQHGVTFGGES